MSKTVTIPTRASYLYLVRLFVSEGELVGVERLCRVTFEHVCTPACTVSSYIAPDSYAPLWGLLPRRDYQVDGSTLNAAENTLSIGYTPGSAGCAGLPTAAANGCAWDAPAGGEREGLQLIATLDGTTCTLSTAQDFISTFSGTLAGTPDAPALVGVERFELDASRLRLSTFGVSGTFCPEDLSLQADTTDAYVRFARAPDDLSQGDAFFTDACPGPEPWDRLLPPAAP